MLINPDADPENADWIKTLSWDVQGVDTEDDLRKYLKSTGTTYEEFQKLPAYKGWLKHLEKRRTQGLKT